MHDIEPYYKWRDHYIASKDEKSPFHGRIYDEFKFTNKVYNYFIHPQWDTFGSSTLYLKIIFVDYEEGFAIIELIGEWNDCIDNDVMYLKRRVIDCLIQEDINKFILICENVLNFHSSEDDYYGEWHEDICEDGGWVVLINTLDHVMEEMSEARLQQYINFGQHYNNINWRPQKPRLLCNAIGQLVENRPRHLN